MPPKKHNVSEEEFDAAMRSLLMNDPLNPSAQEFIKKTFENLEYEHLESEKQTGVKESIGSYCRRTHPEFEDLFHDGFFEDLPISDSSTEAKPIVSERTEDKVSSMENKVTPTKLDVAKAKKDKPSAETLAEWKRQQDFMDKTFNPGNKNKQSELPSPPKRRYVSAEFFDCNIRRISSSKEENEE